MKKKSIFLFLLICLASFNLYSQITVSGTVTDANGGVLPGATVVIKGTSTGEITNFNGLYSIQIPNENAILQFSYLGMIPQDIQYTGQTTINVKLKESVSKLNEVVVIGYGAVKRKDLTGSINTVKDSILQISKTPNLSDALQGRIAGITVSSQSGEPGGAVNYNIRGSNSVYGSNSPLFVVDGVQIDVESNEVASAGVGSVASSDPLQNINPLDIESIDVLKDASATAIYGSRGANGVIIITTKSGKKGDLKFDYSGSVGFSVASNTIDVISPEEYLRYRQLRDPGNPFSYLPPSFTVERDFSNIPNNNWQDEVLRTAVMNNHFLTASGATKNTNYSASVGFLDQEGIIIQNKYRKYNFRTNIVHDQSDKLKLGFTANGAFSESDGVANSGGGGDEFNGVVQQLVISNPWELQDLSEEEAASEEFLSPITTINEGEKQIRFARVLGRIFGQYKITKHLTFRTQLGANFSTSKLKEFHSSKSRFGQRWNGRGLLRQSESNSYNWTNTLRFAKTFKGGHYFNILLGQEFFSYKRESFFLDIVDFDNQALGINDIRIGEVFKDYGSGFQPTKRMSYFNRINYTYKGKYLFTFNFRADGSSNFAEDKRWGYHPGLAFAWRANRENFLKNVTQINDLKLRVGYGVTGNERIPPFVYLPTVDNTFYSSNNNTVLGLSPSSLGNSNLTWERTNQLDLGFDLSMFDNRVNLTFDYYNKTTNDMLIDAPIPAQVGARSQWQNLGSVQNRGVELSLSTVNIKTPNFTWATDFNISANRNEVKDLGNVEFIPVEFPGGWITNPGRVIVGQPIGVMYGLVFDGIYQQGNAEGAEPGTMRYRDLNGDGVINDNDRTVIGDSNPKHTGGFNNSFRYKNFNFSFLFQWSYGNDVFNASRLRTNGFQPFMNITRDYYENAWSPTNPSNTAPAFGKIQSVPSSYFVEDASFLRLKNVYLSYDLPKRLFTNSEVDGLRLYVSANNLLTFTDYSGFDPEVSSRNPLIRGFERFSYPRNTTIVMGVNLKF